jgi:DNA-binding LacI/PurR family transcriptional regulator
MRVSIKDVAARANVSRGTVSHVLNGRTEARIAPETQERVRQAAKELGYVPNQMARSLFHGKTHLIGVVATGISNPFYTELIGACETAIADTGYKRLVDASVPYVARARPEILSVWPVDGILMHGAIGRVSEGVLGARVHVPVVYLDSAADGFRDTVQFDLRTALMTASHYVLARGHTKIGIITPYNEFDFFIKQRYQALYSVFQEVGGSVGYYRLSEDTRRSAMQIGLEIAALPENERPTALFCHSDHLAIGVYHGLKRAGIKVPQEMALIGIDGIDEGDCLDEPLSTIKNPIDELCRIAVSMLRERIEQVDVGLPRHITVPSVFIPKATT